MAETRKVAVEVQFDSARFVRQLLEARDLIGRIAGEVEHSQRTLGGRAPLLRFRYRNWRGFDHLYVIDPDRIECGPYDASGKHDERVGDELAWVLHGWVVTRDGDPRPEMGPTRRRTFLLGQVRELVEVRRSA